MKYIQELLVNDIKHLLSFKNNLKKIDIDHVVFNHLDEKDILFYQDEIIKSDAILEILIYTYNDKYLYLSKYTDDEILKTQSLPLIYLYSKQKKRPLGWPEGEKLILRSPQWSCLYAQDVLRSKWKEAHNIISTSALWSCLYAERALNDRFIEGENIISTSAKYSYWYALDVLYKFFKINWSHKSIDPEIGEQAENSIASNPEFSYLYAKEVLWKPFLKGHQTILNSKYKNDYISFLIEIGYKLDEKGNIIK